MKPTSQRIVVSMIDGLGVDYLQASDMPVLRGWMDRGLYAEVDAVLPTVTNANNVSIICGAWPEDHGITGNSYYDELGHRAEYMEDQNDLLIPTLIEAAAGHGVQSALLTSKKKTVRLMGRGATIALAAEEPPPEYVQRFGPAPDIYSREINYWLWEVASDILANRPDIGFVYVHTTDYPMHMWPAEARESRQHLAELDRLMGQAAAVAPDAAFLVTADHGMNYKTRCWDLARACAARGTPLKFGLSAERDRYVRHHRTFGGTAWVWVSDPGALTATRDVIAGLEGVEAVLTRDEAASRFRLLPERIGDLVVLGDRDTVFGELPGEEVEALAPGFRTHGSLHETRVPLVVHNFDGELPAPARFTANLDLTRLTVAPLWYRAAADRRARASG